MGRRLLGASAIFVALGILCLVDGAAAQALVDATESGAGGITLSFELGSYETVPVRSGDALYTVLEGPGLSLSGEEGAPALPVKSALLTAPPGAQVRARVISEEMGWLDGIVPPPWPTEWIVDDDLPHPHAELIPDPKFYAPGSIHPSNVVEVREVGTLRGHRVISVVFWPFRFDAGRGGVEVRSRAVVRVEFEGGREIPQAPIRRGDRMWEPVLRDLILNYEQGRRWRETPIGASVRDRAFDEQNPEFKIKVRRTSLYRVEFEELSSKGFPSNIGLEKLRLYEKSYDRDQQITVETEVPVAVSDSDSDGMFGPGDSFVFYGLSHWDRFPEKFGRGPVVRPNVYWVSWREAGGARMEIAQAWDDFADPEVPRSFNQTLLFHEDKLFNRTPSVEDVYLFWLLPGRDKLALPFDLPSPDPEEPYGVRMMMQPLIPSEHLLSLYVENKAGQADTVAVRHSFYSASNLPSGKPAYLFDSGVTRPAGFLSEGLNTLKLLGERWTVAGLAAGLGAFVDWYEINYSRRYVAWHDTITCTAGPAGGPQQLEIERFTSGGVLAFDVSDPHHPLLFELGPENIVPGGDGTFTLLLRDEFPERRRIAAAASDAIEVLEDDVIELDLPSDIKSGGAGSEYLVVVHDDLADEVEPLVALREAQGFNVLVARVSDVYDEFGDGYRSTAAIKDFFTYAYNNWGAAYALLVGDANEDREQVARGDWSGPVPPDLVPSPLMLHFEVSGAPAGPELVNTDPWYGSGLDPSEQGKPIDWVPDLFVGRLPAGTPNEARAIISKIVKYEDFSRSDAWRSRGLFVADDNYSTSIFSSGQYRISDSEARAFEPVCDRASKALEHKETGVPGFEAPVFKLGYYLADVPESPKQPSYPGFILTEIRDTTRVKVTPVLVDSMSLGWLFVNYQGHGNENVWTHEYVFGSFSWIPSLDDVPSLGNTGRPFVLFAYSCHMADFDDLDEGIASDCLSERMMLLPDAGAAAAFASSGYEYVSSAIFNTPIMDALLVNPPVEGESGDVHIRIGPAIAKGEIAYLASGGIGNRGPLKTYTLLADPAMRVDAAPPRIVATVRDSVLVDGDRLESLDGEETLDLSFEIRDEVTVDSTSIFLKEVWHRVQGQDSTYNVPRSEYETSWEREGRLYNVDYSVDLLPASMELIAGAVDRNGRPSTITLRAVLSALWEADGETLSPGDLVGTPVDLKVTVSSPVPVLGEALAVAVNGVREDAFTPRQTDLIGKKWELTADGYEFEDGTHTLSLLVEGRPAKSIAVSVDTRFRFSSIVPYPNPCGAKGTTFFYELTSIGAVQVEEVVLKIYSVSGRLVTELRDLSPAIGRGSIDWDAKDRYGERVGNGVYICRAVALNSRGQKASILGKVAVAR